jgi:micrococcal nuclease
MRILPVLVSLFTIIYLSGCAGCSDSERHRRYNHSVVDKSIPSKNTTLNSDSKDIKNNIEEFSQIDIISQNIASFKVIAIIDGDTYDILDEKKILRIRMDGIDAPEKGMPYNKVSKKYLSDLIFGKFVLVKIKESDRHGRSIAQTYSLDGTDISLEMIKAGLAWHYKKYSSNEEYSIVEKEAKEGKRGLWKEKDPISPWEIRKLHRNGISTKKMFLDSPK